MIDGSDVRVRIATGIGALCLAGLLSEMTRGLFPDWLGIAAGLLPLAIFTFVVPGEMPDKPVRALQLLASLWYLFLAISLSIALARSGRLDPPWALPLAGAAIGAVPCLVVLRRVLLPRGGGAAAAGVGSPSSSSGTRWLLNEIERRREAIAPLLPAGAVEVAVLRPSLGKALVPLVACLLLAACGTLLVATGRNGIAGWAGILFFGGGGLVLGANLAPGASGLRLDREGFRVTSLFRSRSVRWADVEGFGVRAVPHARRMVGYRLLPGRRPPEGRLRRILGLGLDGYLPDGYGLEPEALIEVLEAWRRRFAAP